MDYEVAPEPDPEERAALLEALARLQADEPEQPSPYRSMWREQGIRENVDPE